MEKKISIAPVLYVGLSNSVQRKIRRIVNLPDEVPTIIFEAVDIVFDVGYSDLIGPYRKLHKAYARHAFCYLMRKNTKYSLAEIGEKIGGRHHTTVLSSVKEASNFMETDSNYKEQIETANKIIKHKLNGTYFHKK